MVEAPIEKNDAQVKLDHFSKLRGENSKIPWKPPPSYGLLTFLWLVMNSQIQQEIWREIWVSLPQSMVHCPLQVPRNAFWYRPLQLRPIQPNPDENKNHPSLPGPKKKGKLRNETCLMHGCDAVHSLKNYRPGQFWVPYPFFWWDHYGTHPRRNCLGENRENSKQKQ